VTCEHLKHRFLDFIQVAFWGGQEEEYESTVPGDHLKHQFLELTKFEIFGFQEAENESAIRRLESSLYRFEKSRIFG